MILSLYHRLPHWTKTLAASAQGWRLDHLRYGPDTPELVAQAHARENFSHAQWHEWQAIRLKPLLRAASLYVPHYRDYWKTEAGTPACEDIGNWPVLDKQELRADPDRFLSSLADRRSLQHTFTSGSTGTPLKVYWSSDSARRWYSLFEARWRNWHGLNRQDRWAIIGGKQVVRPNAAKPPFWVFNHGMNQLYFSAYHLSPQTAPAYVSALAEYGVRYIYSYTSGVYALAQFILESGLAPPKLDVVITNAEPLFAHQRALIEKAFGCPVRETYGMAEMVAGAGECSQGRLHLWPDAAYHEVLGATGSIASHGSGQLLGTALLNPDMPLIRYRIGDTVTISDDDVRCDCGRTLPILEKVEGRNDDLLLTRDGRRIGRLDPIFKSDFPIREAQIVQKSLAVCELNIVPAPGYSEAVGREIIHELRARMGEIVVNVNLLQHIPRAANGKLKSVVCELPSQTTNLPRGR